MRTSHPMADSFGEIVIETPMRFVLIYDHLELKIEHLGEMNIYVFHFLEC